MTFPAPRLVIAVLLSSIALTASPALTAHAAATKPGASERHHLAAKLAKIMRHDGASQLDFEIYDSTYGTFSANPDVFSAPASNEKIFTTITLLQEVGADFRYLTPVAGTAKIQHHTIHGSLVVRGSGDPTLTRANLSDMAANIHKRGVRHVTGHLIVDDSRYSQKTIVGGWKHKFVPEESGTMDAFSVDHNVWRGGKSYLRNPTLGNAQYFRHQLKKHHVTFGKKIEVRRSPHTVHPLVQHHSPPLSSIVSATLTDSINFDAEMMFREAGAHLSGHGSPKTGLAAERAVAGQLGVPVGIVHDGSGLSYSDRSSPTILTRWLVAARSRPFFPSFYYGLPVSCRTGTLKYRMCGSNVAGQVHAKTGTLDHVSTLSGYVTSESGHGVAFSFLASGVQSYSKLYAKVDSAVALFRKSG